MQRVSAELRAGRGEIPTLAYYPRHSPLNAANVADLGLDRLTVSRITVYAELGMGAELVSTGNILHQTQFPCVGGASNARKLRLTVI
jgi:hypothetical protein